MYDLTKEELSKTVIEACKIALAECECAPKVRDCRAVLARIAPKLPPDGIQGCPSCQARKVIIERLQTPGIGLCYYSTDIVANFYYGSGCELPTLGTGGLMDRSTTNYTHEEADAQIDERN